MTTRQKGRRKNAEKIEVQKISVQGEEDRGQEVIVRHEPVSPKVGKSTWSWHQEFTMEWSETLITRKRNKEER